MAAVVMRKAAVATPRWTSGWVIGVSMVFALGASPPVAASVECSPPPGSQAVSFRGQVRAGQHREIAAGPYRLILEPNPFGWRVQVKSAEGIVLPVKLPPSGAAQAQPGLLGFLYRNADNTGPSLLGQGGVPVSIRLWFGVAATDPTINPRLIVPGRGGTVPDGEVDFLLLDYGLADLNRGQRARMVYASFSGCLSWRDDHADSMGSGLALLPEEIEGFGKCGLDLNRDTPSALFAPRVLVADLDGDGAHDQIVGVKRGEQRGLAICRAGTHLSLLGLGSAGTDLSLEPGFLAALEAWRVLPRDVKTLGYEGEPAWPEADGDIVLLERIEKSAVLLFMNKGRLRALTLYRYVEP